ncbi:MAG: hypothetical protein IPL96_03905 [Holophagaceae bacterium]|nr:hypothetical protein [Holophagaceae bacterium]
MSWIGVQPITLVAGPSEAMCGPGKFVKFAALASRGPVVWEVVDAEGGEFRGDGKFIAPPKPGTYHVRARSLWDPKVAEELTVEVEAGLGDYLADFDPPRSPARPEAKGLSLVPPLVKLDAGTYMSFSASQYQEPDDGPPEAQLQWTAHSLTGTGTATVDRDGVFTASAPGLYEIRIASLQHPERWARAIALVEPSIKPVKGVPSDLSDRTMAGHAALATGETFIVAGRNKALQPIGTCYLRSVDGTGFTRNVDLLGPRWEPLVAALQGGQVLVLGGTGTWKDPSGLVKEGAVPFAEFLDPAARQRVPLPKPVPGAYNGETPSRHVGGSLTALRDGTALACGGGRKAGDPTGPSFLFNPVSGRFEPLEGPDLGQGHAALLLDDGRVFLCGGLDAGGRPSAQCWFFDPRTRRFNAAGTMTMGRAWHAATGLGYAGQILISGGVIEGGRDNEGTSGRPTATCELFKLATGQCVRTGSMNHPRAEHAGVCLPTGQVLVLGGWGKGRKGGPPYYPGVSEDYSSDSAIWSVRDTQPYGVKHPVLLLLQMGNVFLTGEPVASTVPKD